MRNCCIVRSRLNKRDVRCRSRNYIFGCAIARANYETTGVSSKKTGGTSINKNHFEKGCRDGKLVKMIVTRHCLLCSGSK